MDSMKRQKDMTPEDELPRPESVQYITRKEQREITNSFRENEVAGLKQEQRSVVNVSGGERKVQCPRRWWKTGKPTVLQSMGSPGVRHD